MNAALLTLVATLLAFSEQQRAPEPVSRIEGMVVKANGGEPVAQARLLLRKEGALPSETAYATTTSPDGRFALKDIPRGRYRLSATMPGFVDQQYGQDKPRRPGAVLDLTTTQTMRDLTIRMTAGGVISGRVYDQSGRPLEGAVIRALARRYKRDGRALLSDLSIAVTNDLGEYRMYWMTPGTYFLLATVLPMDRLRPGGNVINQSEEAADVFASTFYPNGEDESQAKPIQIEAGAELRAVDFSLTRLKSVRVKGRIIDQQNGQPVASATITMTPKYFDPASNKVFLLIADTDARGSFEIKNVPPGRYRLSTLTHLPGFRSIFNQQDLQIGDRNISNLEITLKPYPSIDGRVIAEGGEMLPEERTALVFNNFDTGGDGTPFGTGLRPDGTFMLTNVTPGIMRLELTGFPDNFFIRSARAGDKDVLRDGLDLTENSVESLQVIVASKGGMLEGVVNDERQAPVVGARVVLMPNPGQRDRIDLFKTTTTDQFGRFTLQGVVPADYKLFAWTGLEPNIYFDPSFMERYESQGRLAHIDEDGHVTANLKAITVD
jgi:protocatechuate 3,4-dioxygenase beta subunit